jgi:hypothetical protein
MSSKHNAYLTELDWESNLRPRAQFYTIQLVYKPHFGEFFCLGNSGNKEKKVDLSYSEQLLRVKKISSVRTKKLHKIKLNFYFFLILKK